MRLRKVLGLMAIIIIIGCVFVINKYIYKKNQLAFKIEDPLYEAVMKRDILSLMISYPEYIKDVTREENNKVYVILNSGKKILYDDKKIKNRWQKAGNPDIQDMMEQIYPLNDITEILPDNYNPGCVRIYPLLKEVYGANKSQVQANLVKVSIGYRFVEFNKQNNAAVALQSVMKELLPLARQNHKVYAAAFPCNGTYNYRLIGGTNRLSSHAFGIAIDLNSNKYDYWRWATREEGQKRLNSYPREVVRAFEKFGFVWGGKWGNFDIMHYEYRPELIFKARYFSEKPTLGLPWYDGLQNNEKAMKYVWLIEERLASG
ncbi:MAG TPA: M15 family metallopeptidase [Peptococcaceae bacterium]|nr:M15 family metallopeptidase [Peptococcaceae bacterium]